MRSPTIGYLREPTRETCTYKTVDEKFASFWRIYVVIARLSYTDWRLLDRRISFFFCFLSTSRFRLRRWTWHSFYDCFLFSKTSDRNTDAGRVPNNVHAGRELESRIKYTRIVHWAVAVGEKKMNFRIVVSYGSLRITETLSLFPAACQSLHEYTQIPRSRPKPY